MKSSCVFAPTGWICIAYKVTLTREALEQTLVAAGEVKECRGELQTLGDRHCQS